jgi:hypothetical protein
VSGENPTRLQVVLSVAWVRFKNNNHALDVSATVTAK